MHRACMHQQGKGAICLVRMHSLGSNKQNFACSNMGGGFKRCACLYYQFGGAWRGSKDEEKTTFSRMQWDRGRGAIAKLGKRAELLACSARMHNSQDLQFNYIITATYILISDNSQEAIEFSFNLNIDKRILYLL